MRLFSRRTSPGTEQIEVYPDSSGGWHWRNGGYKSKQYESRGQAFEDALIERQDEAIVLLCQDGSVHGELYHARGGNVSQHVDILAAATRRVSPNG